jgi:hypothetical protein
VLLADCRLLHVNTGGPSHRLRGVSILASPAESKPSKFKRLQVAQVETVDTRAGQEQRREAAGFRGFLYA